MTTRAFSVYEFSAFGWNFCLGYYIWTILDRLLKCSRGVYYIWTMCHEQERQLFLSPFMCCLYLAQIHVWAITLELGHDICDPEVKCLLLIGLWHVAFFTTKSFMWTGPRLYLKQHPFKEPDWPYYSTIQLSKVAPYLEQHHTIAENINSLDKMRTAVGEPAYVYYSCVDKYLSAHPCHTIPRSALFQKIFETLC